MKAYFDTNVYRFIREKGEEDAVRRVLREYACELEASSLNLFETYAIKNQSERYVELQILVGIANTFEGKPASYRQAMELLHELRRLRPSWLQPTPRTRTIRGFLGAHVERWHQAQLFHLPSADDYSAYGRDVEAGIRQQGTSQRSQRGLGTRPEIVVQPMRPDGSAISADQSNPEVFWRTAGMSAWYDAIVRKLPACRDYADWLGPYLKPDVFLNASYETFWLTEASADSMPLNRLTGLLAYYQLRDKITHGNAADQFHACHWLTSDVFFTADRAFHRALDRVAGCHFPGRRGPVLLNRAAPSCASQLDAALRAAV